ncbi:MAG: C_GCAxxG_C_C family protein, partial [Firmicutes bacterium]|nr:C_GCAxxG_C_C family protein [Bacillota bacterium]
MKAGAGAILLQLQEKVGYPYTMLTPDMYRYGGGGVALWGTLCGTLNGACAMINLVVPAADVGKLCNELLGWYSETALPT